MQDDLIGMFRRAFESGLQTVRNERPAWGSEYLVLALPFLSGQGWVCAFLGDEGESKEGSRKMKHARSFFCMFGCIPRVLDGGATLTYII